MLRQRYHSVSWLRLSCRKLLKSLRLCFGPDAHNAEFGVQTLSTTAQISTGRSIDEAILAPF
jgi:hypothetical protein